MHFDLSSQDQPGDRDEAEKRLDCASYLAGYLTRWPSSCISIDARVATLTQASPEELDRLVPLVEYFLGLGDFQRKHGT